MVKECLGSKSIGSVNGRCVTWEDPLSLYMTKKRKTTEVGVMVHFNRPMCTSLCTRFIEDIEVRQS